MTAGVGTVDWAARDAEAELVLGGAVATGRLQQLVGADGPRPCRAGDPEDWFPVHETPATAAELCAGCAVLLLCRELAVREADHGIWGGTTTQDRLAARRNRQPRAAASDGAAA